MFDKWKGFAKIGIILGSGLNEAIYDIMDIQGELAFENIDGMPMASAPGHVGKYLFGTINNVPVVVLQGRLHFYEGHSIKDVARTVIVLNNLGVESLIITSAVGGINLDYKVGDFMLLTDHINLTGQNPLIGKNPDGLDRFQDMSYAYDREYISIFEDVAKKNNIAMHKGVYIGLTGPSYETPAEIRAFRILGADAVGMSVVPEVIVARNRKMRVAAVSLVSNMAAGVLDQQLTCNEVLEAGQAAQPEFKKLIFDFVTRLGE